jgi:hypothetical protein
MQRVTQTMRNIPLRLSALDNIGHKLIPMDLNYDSAEYKDIPYRQRRLMIGEMSKQHRMNNQIK